MDKDLAQYLDNTFKLVATLTIKSQDSIDKINEILTLKYGTRAVDKYDLTTWKYYKNICGEYHYTDTMMRVVSIDTLEEIDFTKENLAIHTDTKKYYQYGTEYYNRLVEKYPDQEQLILGILYPADMDKAINAEDGSILAYNKDLVEEQEETLILELEEYIKRYLVRWHVRAFNHSDSLYATAQHAIMYLNLVPKVLNLRLKRCKTNEAHSFHIKNYLASHGRLDRFLPYMTLKQKLFLYRNINYIERNVGKMDTFYWLIEKLLTDRRIPIAEFSARYLSEFDENYDPLYRFRKKPLNTPYNVPEKDYFSLKELLAKENTTAPGNLLYSKDKYKEIDTKFKRSLSHVVQTKDLESSIVDYNESVPYPLTDLIMAHWAYLSAKKLFTSAVYFIDPRTGQQKVLMSDTAYLYMLFVSLKNIGIVPVTVPPVLVQRVRRITKPNVDDLMSVVNKRVIKDDKIAKALIDNQPEIIPVTSRSAFFNLCNKIYTASLEEWYLLSNTGDVNERGFIAGMVNRLYFDAWVNFDDTGMLYTDWLNKYGLEDIDYTQDEINQLLSDLYKAATGHIVDPTKLLKNIQAAMIAILNQLSSYSVQIIKEINEINIKPLNWAAIRVGFDKNYDLDTKYTESIGFTDSILFNIRVIEYKTYIKRITSFDIKPYTFTTISYSKQLINLTIKSTVKPEQVLLKDEHFIILPTVALEANYLGQDINTVERIGALNYESYFRLSLDERRSIPDVYHPNIDLTSQLPYKNLDEIIGNIILNGFKLIPVTDTYLGD